MISLYLKNQDVKKIIPGVSRSFSSFFDFRGGFSRSEINFQEVPGVLATLNEYRLNTLSHTVSPATCYVKDLPFLIFMF